MWDEERNAHLFTKDTLEATQLLLDMISEFDLCMVLLKDIPTLEASSTKNYTRVDNVFCSPDIFNHFIECNTHPQWRPQKTDYMLIISKLDIGPLESTQAVKYNFRATHWKDFRKALETKLKAVQMREEITTEEMLCDQIAKLDIAIKTAINEVVPVLKPSLYTKRWWNKDLTVRGQASKSCPTLVLGLVVLHSLSM